ncbi:putative THUMP domain-containing protein [Seiridium cardinale]|uniref:THUMP domain-containing protein n=1 Tax=Seiridium cardinale TaxID=138064 RepID=A0ABR2XFZ8_9PEZI
MGEATKRKGPPGGDSQSRHSKKSKGGNKGKWQTPNHKAKLEALKAKGGTLEVGDVGFWVTCQRTKEQKALEELVTICDEYGEKVYGLKRQVVGEDSAGEHADIEASIQKEIDSMKTANKSRREGSAFAPLRLNLDCLLFVKTKPPVEPRELIRRICEDARLASGRGQRKSRFINRFIPMTLMGRATESGVEEIARTVLAEHFQLTGVEDKPHDETDQGPSYAIRFAARAHNTLKRDDVIKQVASLVGPRHKVNLTTPDKVILVEIFQTFCGMSVVDGDFDALKRYNLNELYVAAFQAKEKESKAEEETGKPEEEQGEPKVTEVKDTEPKETVQ